MNPHFNPAGKVVESMRRLAALLVAAIFVLSLASCGGKKEAAKGFSSASLVFCYDGKSYAVGEKADAFRKAAGEPTDTTSQLSCHYSENGDEYWFDYYFGEGEYDAESGNFADVLRVHTVPLKKGEDTVCDVECYTSRVTTDKGLTVGSTLQEVTDAYGNGYVDEGDGFYTYYDGEPLPDTPRLMFRFVDDKVEYFAVSAAINI